MPPSFQLFDENTSSERRLPRNAVVDEFRLSRFVLLQRQARGTSVPVVLPRDVVNPEAVEAVLETLPSIPVELVRGGSPLIERWKPRSSSDEKIAGTPLVLIKDLVTFARERKVEIGKREYRVEATAEDVARIRAGEILLMRALKGPLLRIGSAEKHRSNSKSGVVGSGDAGDEAQLSGAKITSWLGEFVLPQLDLCVYLPYTQNWELLGYSRGELVHTISLAPQEETSIEIFSWDRLKRTLDQSSSQEYDASLETTFTDKESSEAFKEMSKGGSFSAGLRADVKIPETPVSIGGGLDHKDEMRDVSRETRTLTQDLLKKTVSRIGSSRQVKVTESQEVGIERRNTRKIKNPNLTRTLNLDCFEVLVNYSVSLRLLPEQARVCVLVPIDVLGRIDRRFVLDHEGALRSALLSTVYLQGFSAAKLLAARDYQCSIECAPPCVCPETESAESAAPKPPTATTGAALNAALASLRMKIRTLDAASMDPIVALANTAPVDLFRRRPWGPAIAQFQQALYRETRLEDELAGAWSAANDWARGEATDPETFSALLETLGTDIYTKASLNEIGVFDRIHAGNIINGLLSWNGFALRANAGFNDAGWVLALRLAQNALEAHKSAALAEATKAESAPVATPAAPKEPLYSVRDVAEAKVAEDALLAHLQLNISHYRQAIWSRLNSDDRSALLAGIGDLASRVDLNALGFVGGRIALPLRHDIEPEIAAWLRNNVVSNSGATTESVTPLVSLPTRGVMMESRIGEVDACEEFILDGHRLDLRLKGARLAADEERVEQEKNETERYRRRLDSEPPMLDNPEAAGQGPLRVVIDSTATP